MVKNKIVLILLSAVLIFLGTIGFFYSDIVNSISKETSIIEMPLSNPRGIVVDSQGHIYCGIPNYSRIQVYNNKGQFIKGILLDTGGGGDFNIRFQNDKIYVATIRNKMLYEYNVEGELVKQTSDKNSFNEFGKISQYKFVNEHGIIYELKNPLLIYPHITKLEGGKKSDLVNITFRNWFLMQPIPCWIFLLSGVILGFYQSKKIRDAIKEYIE